MLHLYAYLKEWHKNPQWSFSCCLALILPFLSLPEDISGIERANIMSKQLETGDIEMPTITDAVQDSGAVNISLEEGGESDCEHQKNPQNSTIALINRALENSVEEKKQEDGNTKVKNIIRTTTQLKGNERKIEAFAILSQQKSSTNHQGTQTSFTALC